MRFGRKAISPIIVHDGPSRIGHLGDLGVATGPIFWGSGPFSPDSADPDANTLTTKPPEVSGEPQATQGIAVRTTSEGSRLPGAHCQQIMDECRRSLQG